MYNTQFGAFNGKSWEALCQQVFKAKYAVEGYLPMPASPGDYGIEGYTAHSGLAFQCYCPEKMCSLSELYVNQRDKITADLKKLKKNAAHLSARLGSTKIREWHFVSPVVDKNDLLKHAKSKEAEARAWNLPILANDFTVLLRDGEFYLKEIKEIQSLNGEPLIFGNDVPALSELTAQLGEYEANIARKTRLRVGDASNAERRIGKLTQSTLTSFLESTSYLRDIENGAPTLYFRLLRLINEFEKQVDELGATWTGTPDELTSMLREDLESRILSDLGSKLDSTTAAQIARRMIARWLGVCQLDFE